MGVYPPFPVRGPVVGGRDPVLVVWRQVRAAAARLVGVRLWELRGVDWLGGWSGAGNSGLACSSFVCVLVPVAAPSSPVARPLALPFPGPPVVPCPRVVLPPVPCACGCLPATLGRSWPPCRGPSLCPFLSRCAGGGVGGRPVGRRWLMPGAGWSGATGGGFQRK